MITASRNGHRPADDTPLWSNDYEAMSAAEAIWGKVEHARPGELFLSLMICCVAAGFAIFAGVLAMQARDRNDVLAKELHRTHEITVSQAEQLAAQQTLMERMQDEDVRQTQLLAAVVGNQNGLLTLYKKATAPVARSPKVIVDRTLASFGASGDPGHP